MPDLKIVEESTAVLQDYARIPISFEVRSILELQPIAGGLEGSRLRERVVDPPVTKDYDSAAGEGPMRWGEQWDLAHWAVLSAFCGSDRVGGCVIAFDTPGVDMLMGRRDVAALWDLRVAPGHRKQGIGGRLIDAAVAWAIQHHCRVIKVETQNINVPACRLYAKHGFVLATVDRFAYPELPDEIQLIWSRTL